MDLAELPEPEAADCLPLRDWLLDRLPDLLSEPLTELSDSDAEDFSSKRHLKKVNLEKYECNYC